MNVLIVDDQQAIVDSLKNGIHWENLPVQQVYTATSAKEAKLILLNFQVDVLVSDIEMPEEDGISLCSWAKEKFPDLECIFLTSHADFKYAKEAISLGGFDYILQPVRYVEVENVLLRVWDKIRQRKKLRRIVDNQKQVLIQRNTILDAMFSKLSSGKLQDANQIFIHFKELIAAEYEECVIYPALIWVTKWKRLTNSWDENLMRLTLSNILGELFYDQNANVAVSSLLENRYWVFVAMEKKKVTEEIWRNRMQEFYHFVDGTMDFSIAVYPATEPTAQKIEILHEQLSLCVKHNAEKKKGIYWEDTVLEKGLPQEHAVDLAIAYIKKNLNKNISRTDVAEYVHLNEEYFSRLFKQETGDTFKDYVLSEKMNCAKRLLAQTRLSISIVASKTGYDNCSHFSKMFKKVTNKTPQEYRKENQNYVE